MARTIMVFDISPWELVQTRTDQREIINHLDGEQLVEWVAREKARRRDREAREGNL